MSIEIIIRVDGVEYEFIPKPIEGGVGESSDSGDQATTTEDEVTTSAEESATNTDTQVDAASSA